MVEAKKKVEELNIEEYFAELKKQEKEAKISAYKFAAALGILEKDPSKLKPHHVDHLKYVIEKHRSPENFGYQNIEKTPTDVKEGFAAISKMSEMILKVIEEGKPPLSQIRGYNEFKKEAALKAPSGSEFELYHIDTETGRGGRGV